MSTQEKVFVGNAKVRTNKFNEKETNIGFTADDLKTLEQHLNEKGWVNVTVKSSRDGKPYVQVDTWKPNGNTASAPAAAGSEESAEELPF